MNENRIYGLEGIADLDAVAASDALAAARDAVLAAEARQLFLAAHWADLHAPEFVSESRESLPGGERGAERARRIGADGCPEMMEFASAELAALLGRSPVAGESFIADAVNLRHRHPLLWAGIAAGRVRVWLAVKAARRCAAVELSREQALWVDGEVAPYAPTLTPGRFLDLVEAKIREVDPAGAQERAEAAALRRFVRTGQTDEAGLKTLVARAEAGDIVVFVAMVDRIAGILAERGDTDSADGRRASALRVMADPAQALALLASAALAVLPGEDEEGAEPGGPEQAEQHEPGQPAPPGAPCPWDPEDAGVPAWRLPDDESTAAAAEADRSERERIAAANGERSDGRWAGRPAESVEWMRDAAGEHLPPHAIRADLTTEHPADKLADSAHDDLFRLGDRALLRSLIRQLEATHRRLRPVCVFHVHTTREALREQEGVARVEELGPQVLAELRAWLAGSPCLGREHPPPIGRAEYYTHADARRDRVRREAGCVGGCDCEGAAMSSLSIRLTPVLDPDGIAPVDRYEVPAPMRRAVEELSPYEVFPYGTQASRTCDKDHVTPYRPGARGQTRPRNLAPLGRHAHRLKTHGRWRVSSTDPGRYRWTSPTGHVFEVGPGGTTHRGRDPDPGSELDPYPYDDASAPTE